MTREPRLYFEDIPLGLTREVGEIELTAEEIVDFARQWDPLTFHTDPEAAAESPLGGLTAAGCHVFCAATRLTHRLKPLAVIAGLRQELEFPHPARPGDRLTLRSECVERRASRSKLDRGIVVFQCEVRNQSGATVLNMRSTLMLKRRPAATRSSSGADTPQP